MNLLSRLLVSVFIMGVIVLIFRLFIRKKLGSSQTVFWLGVLGVAWGLALFPSLVDFLSIFWGNLWPVSWITFIGMVVLITYLLFLSVQVNDANIKLVELARNNAFLEKKLRDIEDKK